MSASLGPILMAPVFTADPTVSGVLHVGETISASIPEVQEFPVFATTYEWLKCSSAVTTSATSSPNGCSAVGRSAGASLTLTSAEAGQFIVVIATNTNSQGTAVKTSVTNLAVTSTPVNTVAPAISGDPLVASGNFLAVSAGSWTASPAVTIADYSYAWFACTTAKSVAPTTVPSDCNQISGATASSISPTDDLAGKFVIARVTATVKSNKPSAGAASVFTTSIGKVRNKPQFGSQNPSIAGVAHFDESLTATLAPVSGFETPTSPYAWWVCNDAVTAGTVDVSSTCSVISGSQDAPLKLRAEHVGKRIVLVQTATNPQGSATRSSASTLVVSATPTISSDPVITGSNVFSANATVSVTKGTWTGTPTPSSGTFSYTWYVCTTATVAADVLDASCTLVSPVSSTTDFSTINLNRDWDGKYLVARETVTTSTNKANAGTARRFTAGFGPINVAATVSVDPPISSKTASPGTRLRANVGTWVSNTKPISYTYQWFACSAAVTTAQATAPTPGCSLISGFDSADLVVPSSAVNKYILLVVTATNAGGKSTRTSTSTNLVTAAAVAAARLGWMR